jgi:hypothetical protein
MYDDDDLSVLDIEGDLESPLDHMEPVDAGLEEPKPDPRKCCGYLKRLTPISVCWQQGHFVSFRTIVPCRISFGY